MAQNRLLIDYKLCFGCYACEIACKQENDLPVGPRWIIVKIVGPRKIEGKLTMDFVPLTCMHCDHPPCIEACPVDAITKREDGIVLISSEHCIGCLVCLQACPFGAIQWDSNRNSIGKCNLCLSRIERGLKPACVQACPAGAIQYGEVNAIINQARQTKALKKVISNIP